MLSNGDRVLHFLKENHSNFHLWRKRAIMCHQNTLIDTIAFQTNVHQLWSLYYSDSRLKLSEAGLPFCSQIRTSHCPMCWKRWSAKQEGGRHIRTVRMSQTCASLIQGGYHFLEPHWFIWNLKSICLSLLPIPHARAHTHTPQLGHLLQASMTR